MEMQARRYIPSSNYRYGFNGKENDDEVKGESNQIDYGERVYDPRAGRFLSTDPFTKKFPELTPFQYASNSPISGVDLDGKEYLRSDEARVAIGNGVVRLNMENMHNIIKNSFNDANNNPMNWESGKIGIANTQVASFQFLQTQTPDFVSTDNTYGATDPNYNAGETSIENPLTKKGLTDRRFKQRTIETVSPSGNKILGIGSLIVNTIIVGDGIARHMLGDDDQDKVAKHTVIAEKALFDVNTALKEGLLIPPEYRTEEILSDIANVVLSGVSNSKELKVIEIGKSVYENISKRRFPYDGVIIIRGPSDMIKTIQKPNLIYDPNYSKNADTSQKQTDDKGNND